MKPQNAFRLCLSAVIAFSLILAPCNPVRSAITEKNPASSGHYPPAADKMPSSQKTQGKQSSHESMDGKDAHHAKSSHHSDEEKHNNHNYDYSWIRHKKQIVASLMQFFIKVFVAVCFFSVLLCTYMSIAH
jgi:hypothetical protein